MNNDALLGILITLVAYRIALVIHKKAKGHVLTTPILVGTILVLLSIAAGLVTYSQYKVGGQWITALLGPATVALAVPLYVNLSRIKKAFGPLLISLSLSSLFCIVSSMALAQYLGLPKETILTVATRSISTPIAMSVTDLIGGISELAGIFVAFSGIIGAIFAQSLLKVFRVEEAWVVGFATGLSAHGAGTARMMQLSETAGAFSGLAMGLNGIFTAVVLPILVSLWKF